MFTDPHVHFITLFRHFQLLQKFRISEDRTLEHGNDGTTPFTRLIFIADMFAEYHVHFTTLFRHFQFLQKFRFSENRAFECGNDGATTFLNKLFRLS